MRLPLHFEDQPLSNVRTTPLKLRLSGTDSGGLVLL